MHVWILGGSNSGPKTGWAAALEEVAPEHRIENHFLGAVGSLFGLLRLLKMRQEGGEKPDVVVFEYALNDSLWLLGKNITIKLIEDALHDVVTFCAQENIRLLFLCLCLRPPEPEGKAELSKVVDAHYRSIALSRGAADCLLLDDILGSIRQSQYVDSAHIGPEPSRMVAEAVAARLKEPIPVPKGANRPFSLDYLDASKAVIEGPGVRAGWQSSVFAGPFVELSRGGKSLWEIEGRLVALLLRSTEKSGSYRIKAGDRMIRKNAQSLARENVPNLVGLHYVTHALPDASRVEISLPESEARLMALPYDLTLMDGPAHVPFEEQTLELGGVMFYRPRSLMRRAIGLFSSR